MDGDEKTTPGVTIFQFSMYHIMKEALQPRLGKEYFRLSLNNPDHWDFFKNLKFIQRLFHLKKKST